MHLCVMVDCRKDERIWGERGVSGKSGGGEEELKYTGYMKNIDEREEYMHARLSIFQLVKIYYMLIILMLLLLLIYWC